MRFMVRVRKEHNRTRVVMSKHRAKTMKSTKW